MVRGINEQNRKLFIGGLSYETTDDGLKSYFSTWGEIVDCVVMRDPATKKSRGFGFITYSEPEMVDDAQNNRPHIINGREVEPKRAVPREDSNKPEAHVTCKKIYVSGIKDGIEEEDLREYFSDFGNVESVEIMVEKDNPNKKRGFAFVTFDDYDPADKCILLKSHHIKDFRCDCKKAISKKEMDNQPVKSGRGDRSMSYGGRGGNRGGRDMGNGRGGMGGGGNFGNNDWNDYGNSYGSGMGGGMGGGNWNQGGGNGWNQGGGNWNQGGMGGGSGNGGGFGSNYGSDNFSGAMRNNNNRTAGPYGGGYSSGGGGGGSGGNYRRM